MTARDLPRCPTSGKVCYTQAEAKEARANIQRVRLGRFSKYRCVDAHLHADRPWHIGHIPKRKRRARPIIGPIGD